MGCTADTHGCLMYESKSRNIKEMNATDETKDCVQEIYFISGTISKAYGNRNAITPKLYMILVHSDLQILS